MDMFTFNFVQSGFGAVADRFNGLEELLKRRDAGECLLAKYKEMDPGAFDASWSLEKKGEYAMRFCFVEILLAQESILDNMEGQDRNYLIKECIKKTTEKRRHSMYCTYDFTCTALVAGRILQKENFKPFTDSVAANKHLYLFLQRAPITDLPFIAQIIEGAVKFSSGK